MDPDALKRAAARAALAELPEDAVIGVGTGSTVNHFIAALGEWRRLRGAVSSSEASSARLRALGIALVDLNAVEDIPVYVDGADAITPELHMTKGGGGALTREKIVAAVARRFICVADASKQVSRLGGFPIPVEVLPMARAQVARALHALGGKPTLRADFVTDNGNCILDVHGLDVVDAIALEDRITRLAGVVCCGIFARRGADLLLLADQHGVHRIEAGPGRTHAEQAP